MGEVYRATDTKLGRDVAIKVLPSFKAGSPRVLFEGRYLQTGHHYDVSPAPTEIRAIQDWLR